MSKAPKTSTLAIKPETRRSPVPSKLRKLAARVAELYAVYDEAERIEGDAKARAEAIQLNAPGHSEFSSLRIYAEYVRKNARRQLEAIEGILKTDPGRKNKNVRIPGFSKLERVFVISSSALFDEESDWS